MRDWERATWQSGQTEPEVIRRVGQQVAQWALRLTRPGEAIAIAAGKGNNGADARAAAAHLADRHVQVLDLSAPTLHQLEQTLNDRPALLIDGLFGIGLHGPLGDDWLEVVRRINQSGVRVLAVDVPSGLNADTGEPMPEAIRASVTLAVGAPKEGLLHVPAWPYVGRLEITGDIGLGPPPAPGELAWTLAEDFSGFPPRREEATHKGTFGHLGILAGSMGYHGAAVLAARGAQRARPGLITVLTTQNAYYSVAAQCQSVMVRPWTPEQQFGDEFSALVIGPGLAGNDVPEGLQAVLRRLWRDARFPILIDASGLGMLGPEPTPKHALRVITPHPGEAGRLLKANPLQIQATRLQSLRALSQRFGNPWVVLKGHQTLVGHQDGTVYVNSSGGPHLAQGGSGDLLAGYLGGLLAQPALQADPLLAIRYAVWQHGAAADDLEARRPNWILEELANDLGLAPTAGRR